MTCPEHCAPQRGMLTLKRIAWGICLPLLTVKAFEAKLQRLLGKKVTVKL